MSRVVKLGGSFLASPRLVPLLAALGRTPAAVVAGGGPFADQVREAQARLGFDDRAAHLMALMAMNQTALACAALAPALAPLGSEEALAAALARGESTLFLPWPAWAALPELPASWEVTSDSIALLLARRLGLPLLVLKRALPEGLPPSPAAWAEAGVVDPFFPRLAAGFPHPLLLRDEAWAEAHLLRPAPLSPAALSSLAEAR